DAAEEPGPLRGRAPGRDGRLTPGEHEARVVWQRRYEYLSDPCIRQAKDLIVVEDQHDARPASAQTIGQADKRPDLGPQESADRVHNAALGGLNRAAVDAEQPDGPSPPRPPDEGVEQGRLADSTEAMNVNDQRARLGEQRLKQAQLGIAADERIGGARFQ